jgi:hypothetical protein
MTPTRLTLEERLEAAENASTAKDQLEWSHALLRDVEEFKRHVSDVRAQAAFTLFADGNAAEGGRLYSQLEISRLLNGSPALGQQLVNLGRHIRDGGGRPKPARKTKAERSAARQAELERIARNLLARDGLIPDEESA